MEVDRMEDVISVFGSFDQNLRMIETELQRARDRPGRRRCTSPARRKTCSMPKRPSTGLLSLAAKGEEIDEQNVRYIFRLVREGREQKIQRACGRCGVHHGQGQAHQGQDARSAARIWMPLSENTDHARRRPGRHRQDLPRRGGGGRGVSCRARQPHHPHAPGG